MKGNRNLVFFLISVAVINIAAFQIPFFWDGPFMSSAALHFMENGFSPLIPNLDSDSGLFPLYSMYLSISWMLFGKTLLISHIAFAPIAIGFAYEFVRFGRKYLSEPYLSFGFLLFLFDPAIITQMLYMGYDILLGYLFLFSLNRFLERKIVWYYIGLLFISICSLRGLFLMPAFFVLHLIHDNDRPFNKRFLLSTFPFVIPLLVFIIWSIYHYHHTGWILFSPIRTTSHQSLAEAPMVFRQAGYIVWKLLDSGRVFIWLFILAIMVWKGKRFFEKESKSLLEILLIPLTFTTIPMVFLKNPIGHKYFIFIFPVLTIYALYVMQKYFSVKKAIIPFCIMLFTLIWGNFWMYPERYGNAWDTSLKSIAYHRLQNDFDEAVAKKGIMRHDIATEFPLFLHGKYTFLNEETNYIIDLDDTIMVAMPYILHSNISNSFHPDEKDELEKNWKLIIDMKRGQVYMRLYKNPLF